MAAQRRHLVIGATGTTGSRVASLLLKKGEKVRALVRAESKASALRQQGAEVIVGDLDDRESLGSAFDSVDSTFVVTSVNPNTRREVANALEAAKNAGVRHFVRYSAAGASADSPLPTSRDHFAIETEIADSGIPYTVVRTHFFMQNLLGSVPTIESDSAIYMPLKDGRLAMVDVRDVAEAAVEALVNRNHIGEVLTITGPASISMSEAACALSEVIGKRIRYVNVPLETERERLSAAGVDTFTIGIFIAAFRAFSEGHGDFVSDDFVRVTGRRQRTFEQFVRDHTGVFGAVSAEDQSRSREGAGR